MTFSIISSYLYVFLFSSILSQLCPSLYSLFPTGSFSLSLSLSLSLYAESLLPPFPPHYQSRKRSSLPPAPRASKTHNTHSSARFALSPKPTLQNVKGLPSASLNVCTVHTKLYVVCVCGGLISKGGEPSKQRERTTTNYSTPPKPGPTLQISAAWFVPPSLSASKQ